LSPPHPPDADKNGLLYVTRVVRDVLTARLGRIDYGQNSEV